MHGIDTIVKGYNNLSYTPLNIYIIHYKVRNRTRYRYDDPMGSQWDRTISIISDLPHNRSPIDFMIAIYIYIYIDRYDIHLGS